jgi:ubiquinol-cytochrome c reductase iron-sulfur subunit
MAEHNSDQGHANDNTALNRRTAMVRTGQVLGTAAVAGSMYPFVSSLQPSRKTKAEGAAIRIDIGGIQSGEMVSVSWRRKPVWIIRRNPDMIRMLSEVTDSLSDPDSESSVQPDYCRNPMRSIREDVFVAIGICTHLGCIPGLNGSEGFLCACHGSRFDFAGRVFNGSPAPANLPIPSHYFEDDRHLVVGEESSASA